MLNLNSDLVAAALKRELPWFAQEQIDALARNLVTNTDPRLEENVREWISREPLKDIWIGKYSITAIMEIRQDQDFLGALEAMNLYLQNPQMGELKIWRSRR